MAYDEDLAGRVRALLAREPDVTERRMFGGLAFLVGGAMAVAAGGQGGLMVRVDPEEAEALLGGPHVGPVEMRGRPVRGWLRVGADAIRSRAELEAGVARGVAFARAVAAER